MTTSIPVLDNKQLEIVVLQWSNEHGRCDDCGLPAAYLLHGIYGPETKPALLCSVCAAWNVAHGNGNRLEHLFPDEPET